MKQTLSVVLVGVALAGWACGGGDSQSTGNAPTAPSSSEGVDTAVEAPTISEAKAFVESFIPEVKTNIRDSGADLLGTPDLKCAATGGPETECLLEIPYRRLDECAIAFTRVFVINSDTGVTATENSGNIKAKSQICYIGPDGEPVPEMP